jgi:GTP-binding protein
LGIRVLQADFLTTAVAPEGYPRGQLPEVAFAGRSNVGKSSMINALTGRKKLVRVSNTPGRTRTLNFFDVALEVGRKRHELRLADLPGYGFAKASKAERAQWEGMISAYLEQRRQLVAVVTIIDGEVGPTRDDLQMIEYLIAHDRKILVVATKMDRLPKAKRRPQVKALAAELSVPEPAVLPFSAVDRFGVDEVWDALVMVSGRKEQQK